LAAALDELVILGVPVNADYLGRILRHPAFLAGQLHTGFVPEHAAALAAPALSAEIEAALFVAAALGDKNFRRSAYDVPEPHASIGAWRN
jgi:propionyl-CoA carboxylase alpha chain/3-methylcrotonyl-CoA carboxylase alpha subunit/acetyl-CoA/propionyl-CoA carboxylase biotin carboxyl carrier protein